MVGFLQSPNIEEAIEEEKKDLKTQLLSDYKNLSIPDDPLHLCQPELEGDISSSFSDSFLDFDSFGRWLMEGNPEHCGEPNIADFGGNAADFGSQVGAIGVSKERFELGGNGISKEVEEDLVGEEGSSLDLKSEKKEETGVFERRVEMGVCETVILEEVLGGDGPGGESGCLIEEKLANVSLIGNIGSDSSLIGYIGSDSCSTGHGAMGMNGNGIKVDETVTDEDDSDCTVKPGSESSSSSSSSSSGEEEEAKNEEGSVEEQTDAEEGEIVLSDTDGLVDWSDNEDAETGMTGPITSKNELKVLPPVPSVCVTLQPHHQTLPVGEILSIIGAQVIVQGVEKHNPLNEGSILWITQSRSPLGIIDEIFGPVKNPCYIVRYNSESEAPDGIQQGTLISFVQEFANHVLNDKSLYKKGYDASGENDEELSDELEFSDDEEEAAYRRMLKMKKRGTNESNPGTKRKEKRQQKNHTGNWNPNNTRSPLSSDKVPVTQDQQHLVPPIAVSSNQENFSCSSRPGQDMASYQPLVSPFPHRAQVPGFAFGPRQDLVGNQAMVLPFPLGPQGPGFSHPNGIWSINGFPHQQQQNGPFQIFQTPLQTNMAFQQPMGMIPGLPFNFNALGGQPNFVGSPVVTPWPTNLHQNTTLNQAQFGMAFQGQHGSVSVGVGGEESGQSQGPQNSLDSQLYPESSNFSQGRGGGGGRRRGLQRGRGRSRGGRGRHQSH